MSMHNWNPFQTPLSLDDGGSTSNGLRLNMLSPTGSSSSSAALGFGLNRSTAIGSSSGNGLGNFATNGSFGMRGGIGQQQPISAQSSSSMFNGLNRVTSPFSQQAAPPSVPSFQSFDNYSTGRSMQQQQQQQQQPPKNYGGSSFQQGLGSNELPMMNGGLGYEPKPASNGWNSMSAYGYGAKPVMSSVTVGATAKFGSVGGMQPGFSAQSSFNEPSMFQRSNSLNMSMYRSQPQTSPPMSVSSGSGGDIFSQADMFSVDSGSGRKREVDNFRAGRWDSGPSRPGEGPPGSQGARETGIIEKLLHSYGFIQCCERQARLFFHFSQFDGNIEHLKIGDPVEFEMTYDRRTGKPIASSVSKISSEVVSQQMQGEERVLGTVTTEITGAGPGRPEINGRISYENRGECFFLPYGRNDIEGHVTLSVGDRVSFLIATDQRTGNLAARCVRLENPAAPVRYTGIVGSISGDSGTIDRGDVVRQIGFTVSELEESMQVGHHVEFSIQTVNGKELAGSIKRLPDGTVVFEDIDHDMVRGQVLKTPERRDSPDLMGPNLNSPNSSASMFGSNGHGGDNMSGKWTPPSMTSPMGTSSMGGSASGGNTSSGSQNRGLTLSGRIRYRGKDRSEVEIPFGFNDQKGNFTLRHGDWVSFHIATDRRDQQQRATKITLLDDSFMVSGEKREQGIVRKLEKESEEKPAEGLIECADREALVNFTVHELLDETENLHVKDEVELTVVEKWVPAGGTRPTGLRIKKLPKGSVQFEILLQENLTGEVSKEALVGKDDQPGLIMIDSEHCPPGCANTEVIYYADAKDENILVEQDKLHPDVGDKVRFDLVQLKKNRKLMAMRVKVIEARPPLFDPNTDMPPLPPSPLFEDYLPAHLAPILAPVPDTLPSPLKPQLASVVTPSPSASPAASPAPQLVNLDIPHEPQRLIQGLPDPPIFIRRQATGETLRGYIAGIKEREGFGFIEKAERDSDVYFRLAVFEGDATALEVGVEVEYCIDEKVHKSGRESADYVVLVPTSTVPNANIRPELLLGVVMRPLKSWNPEQPEYCGIIKNGTADDADGQMYEFGVTSVAKRVQLQVGDAVQFQVETSTGKAVNIKPCRNKLRSTVECVKGTYGFLTYEYEEGKKLFYSQSEVKDKSNLQVGDQVEFELVTNKRSGKSAACSIVKLTESQRPERLISRLRGMNVVDGKRVKVLRQPRGPDGTKGFHPRSLIAAPGSATANGSPSPPSSPISMASSVSSL